MNQPQRIYLDHAATSWPKPDRVYQAVDHYQREVGAPYGRSGYREARQARRVVDRAREGVAEIIGASRAEEIVFTASGTDSLNLAILGLTRPGDHLVTTVCEHNSVLRPLQWLQETRQVLVTYIPCDKQGRVSAEDVATAVRPHTRMVVVQHGSNVTGVIQPIEKIGQLLADHPASFLVDAAQTVGHLPLDVKSLGVDLLAAPGHKGLLGPAGTGILYLRSGVEQALHPLRTGGTGTHSRDDRQPQQMPEKYESGSPNLPGLAGLAAACDFLREQTVTALSQQLAEQTEHLLIGLENLASSHPEILQIQGPTSSRSVASLRSPSAPAILEARTCVVSLTLQGYDPQELAILLESAGGIQARAGLHCAPRMHQALGTQLAGGTLRFSLGWSTTLAEIDQVLQVLAALM